MGCGLSKFGEEERGPNPEVKFVYPRNEAPVVNDKDVGDELEIEQCSNNGGRKSVSVEKGFLKKVFGNASEKGSEKDVEGDQGGRRSISSNSPMVLENGLFKKESGLSGKSREFSQDENLKRVNSMDKMEKVNSADTRFSVDMAKEEARMIGIEVATKEAERIEVAKEEEKMNSTTEDGKMSCSTMVGKEEAGMPHIVDQVGKEERTGSGEEYRRENSLLFPPGSPSFRIYCLLDKDGTDNAEEGEQQTTESKLPPTGRVKTAKRRRRTSLLRTVLNRGGSASGVKNFLNVKNSTPTQDSSSRKIAERSAS